MYHTGTLYNLENRLHSSVETEEDLSSFLTEASGYAPVSDSLATKLSREFTHATRQIHGVAAYDFFLT